MTLDRSAPASVDLLARIRASLSSLSPAELRIAEIIEADPSLASTLTVNDPRRTSVDKHGDSGPHSQTTRFRGLSTASSRAGGDQRVRYREHDPARCGTSLLPTRPVR